LFTTGQADEMRAYSNSAAGIITLFGHCQYARYDPYATLRITGEWNSKTTEDYLAMCKDLLSATRTTV
jgi:hypothetical protein